MNGGRGGLQIAYLALRILCTIPEKNFSQIQSMERILGLTDENFGVLLKYIGERS